MALRSRRPRTSKPRSPASKYWSCRRKPLSKSEEKAEVYIVEGTVRKTQARFLKVGRSKEPSRRLKEHQERCKCVEWKSLESFPVEHSHRAEGVVHANMEMKCFVKFEGICSCNKTHRERFTHPEMDIADARKVAEGVIVKHQDV
ncbi:hypothetical protein V5O48_011799 [Marasmius crinis-equi]|uniref:Bacteriophage T5 Orf172 DNA-binding domain-containing protein n=1 Tax=Marasmius crinis-equi TaxID=585013 RepID=A0ABR3F4J5_9AGAR